MSDQGEGELVGEAEVLQDLLLELSSQISKEVKELGMLQRIATALGQQVPDENKANQRLIKRQILLFLNGDEVLAVPGILDLLTKLQEVINQYLYPEPDSDEDRTGKKTEDRHDIQTELDDGDKYRADMRGVHRGGSPSSRGGHAPMPLLRHNALSSQPQQSGFGFGDFGGPRRSSYTDQANRGGRHSSGGRLGASSSVDGDGTGGGRRSGGVGWNLGSDDGQDGVPVVPVAAHRLREFKIHGKIGEPPEEGKPAKDGYISFSNIMLQIRDGVAAKYSEREIVGAVVRAVMDASLRDFLVESIMAEDFNVEELQKVLSTHFKVKDATSLYNQMIRRSQGSEESVMKFVQEMMKLRTQVFRLSQAEGGSYSKKLLQTEMQRAVYNGLRQNEVRQALRVTLKQEVLSDSDLREEISELMLNEADHHNRLAEAEKTKSKSVSIKQVDAKTKKEKEDNIMVHVVQQLDGFKVDYKKDMADFKTDVLNKLTPLANNTQQCAPATNNTPQYTPMVNNTSQPTPAATGFPGGFAGGYNMPQYPPFYGYPGSFPGFYGGYPTGPVLDGNGGGNTNGGNSNGGNGGNNNDGGNSNRGGRNGRGGRGGRNGRKGGNGLKKPVTMCQICTDANALFCNHCHICGNVDHHSWGCPHKDDPDYKKKNC